MSNFPTTAAAELIEQPWMLRVADGQFLVRPVSSVDLAAVALMHRRCSGRSLLGRYRRGGAAPSVAALDVELRNPYGVVAVARDDEVVAIGALRPDPKHSELCAEIGLLVEDRWQRKGIGAELAAHLAGTAALSGFHQLIAYPATTLNPARRLLEEIGPCRLVLRPQLHLHTVVPQSAELGLGAVRQRLAS